MYFPYASIFDINYKAFLIITISHLCVKYTNIFNKDILYNWFTILISFRAFQFFFE